MFGKICRSVEHFLHWCKRRGGQQGRGRSSSAELRVRAPGHGPPAHVPLPRRGAMGRLLSILDPFFRTGYVRLGRNTDHSSPAGAEVLRKGRSPMSPRPPLGLVGKAQRSVCKDAPGAMAPAPCAGLPREDGGQGTTVAYSLPKHGTEGWQRAGRGSAPGRGGRFPATPIDNFNRTSAGSSASAGLSSGQLRSRHTPAPALSRVPTLCPQPDPAARSLAAGRSGGGLGARVSVPPREAGVRGSICP